MSSVDFTSANEAARRLGCARGTLDRRQARGLVPRYLMLPGNRAALLRREVAALISANLTGKSDDEVRALVAALEADRARVASELLAEAA